MEETKFKKNFDGELVDFNKDDLVDKLTFESANFIRRMLAYLIDLLLIVVVWYLITKNYYQEIDQFMETLGSRDADFTSLILYDQFRNLFWRLLLDLSIVWVAVKIVYFMLVPAFLGDGRTVGKMVAGIGTVDAKTLEEITPTKLMIRELLVRGLLETALVIPGIVSLFIAFFREDSKSLHDLIAKTVVIKLDLYDYK